MAQISVVRRSPCLGESVKRLDGAGGAVCSVAWRLKLPSCMLQFGMEGGREGDLMCKVSVKQGRTEDAWSKELDV